MDKNSYFESNRDIDPTEVEPMLAYKIEKDVCLLYHQLAEYNYIMGDLMYGSVFDLPYWNFLNLNMSDFARDGCLVMILAMAWEYIDGAGSYIRPYLSLCQTALSQVPLSDDNITKLVKTVKLSLSLAEQVEQKPEIRPETDELIELSSWVHQEYVKGYFYRQVDDFDNNPFYQC